MRRGSRGSARRVPLFWPLVFALGATGCVVNLTSGDGPPVSPAASAPTPTAEASTSSTPAPSEVATAVVLVVQQDATGTSGCFGSGTLIDAAGTIVTNFHVVEVTDQCDYERLVIGMSASEKAAPDLRYVARVHAYDADLDLAVLKITATLDGGPVSDPLPFVELGDSDDVHIGDALHVYGYPGIGGATITSTPGEVSGFTASAEVAGSAWIKTSAMMAGGNSGGLAADSQGRMVGIPTRAGAADADDIVDCRRADTNKDGFIDAADGCVPVGGFINSVRPVNLARALIGEAATSDAVPTSRLTRRAPDSDASPQLSAPVFAAGADVDSQPIGVATSFPSGADRVCLFYDYQGTGAVTTWESVWTRDQAAVGEAGIADTWTHGDSGTTWFCTGALDGLPLEDGLWEVQIYLDGEPDASLTRSVFVGDGHDEVEMIVSSSLDRDVCILNLSPSKATSWQGNLLSPETVLAPGGSLTLELPAGTYDVLARDCDGIELVDLRQEDVMDGAVITLG